MSWHGSRPHSLRVLSTALSLTLALILPGCDLCWPRGGDLGRCIPANDDDVVNDDDSAANDDDSTGDDDDATPDCLTPRPRPSSFEQSDTFGYGYVTTNSADPPQPCWFVQEDRVEVVTDNLSSAGASVSHDRIEWDFVWYGVVAEVVRLDVNGAVHFDYWPSVNPGNSCFAPQQEVPVLAAYWDNLDMLVTENGSIVHGVVGQAPNRIAVGWWRDMARQSDDGVLSFQVHLHEATGHIEVHYRDTGSADFDSDLGRGATVGILADDEDDTEPGLWVGCNDPVLENDFAIGYWPPE